MKISRFQRSAHARNIGSLLVRVLYRAQVVGLHNVPTNRGILVVASGIGSTGLILVKSMLPRPSHALVNAQIPDLGGELPLSAPYSIDSQLEALDVLRGGGAIVCDLHLLDPGFLINESQALVIPVAVWTTSQAGDLSEWSSKVPAVGSAVSVYFGQGKNPSEAGTPESLQGGRVRANRFASEWCRQILQDHRQMVLHRLGGRAAQ